MDDRISELPDDILGHILSFLPTEDAFTTTLLSKRWKLIWLLVPVLNFDDRRFITRGKPYVHFMDMVKSIICAKRKHRKPIKKMYLKCRGYSNYELLEVKMMLLFELGNCGVEHLEFQALDTLQFYFIVFNNFSNLVVLKFKSVHLRLFLPAHFQSLKVKTLHLNDVYFFKDSYIRKLVNSCPILEDFEAKNIYVDYNWSEEYKEEFKSLTNLVRADISDLNSCDVPLEAFSNVQFLRVEKMYGHVPVFPNLTHAELVFQSNVDWSWVFRVLEKLPKLQNLVLEMPELSTSVKSGILIPSISPECLSSQFKECTITNYRGQEYELKFAQYIMLNSKSLRQMIICSPSFVNDKEKLAMQMELLSFPKSSSPCQIYFK